MYNFLMFRTIFSIFSIISLIKVDVFILYCLDYSLCFSSETSTLISFGIIYSKKHSILQSDGYPELCYIINENFCGKLSRTCLILDTKYNCVVTFPNIIIHI